MKTLSLEQAQKNLEPYLTDIASAIRNGFDDFLNIQQQANSAGFPVEYEVHTKASMVHDYTKVHIQNAFRGNALVKVGVFNKIFGVCISDLAFIRFKKFNSDLSTSNIPTEQTKLYNQQSQILGLPDAPTYLYAGYRPNATWTGLEDIYVINRVNDDIEWVISISKYSTEQSIIPFSVNTSVGEVRVKIKPELVNREKTS